MKLERGIAYYVITTTTTITTDINYSDNYIIITVAVVANNRFKVKSRCKYQNHVWERPSLGITNLGTQKPTRLLGQKITKQNRSFKSFVIQSLRLQ